MEEIIKKYKEICQLFDIKKPSGYSEKEIDEAIGVVGPIPEILKLFYRKCGKSLAFFQDQLILPNRYPALLDDNYITFFDENQGVCQAGIKKTDVSLIDPPVYINIDKDEWEPAADKLSDFLVAMYGYQASICLEYNPEEIYFISKEEVEKIEERFTKRPEVIKSWIDKDSEITLYGNDNCRISLMKLNDEDDLQMIYAANSEEEFEKMAALLSDIGEAI